MPIVIEPCKHENIVFALHQIVFAFWFIFKVFEHFPNILTNAHVCLPYVINVVANLLQPLNLLLPLEIIIYLITVLFQSL
jgi:hypothetical protein